MPRSYFALLKRQQALKEQSDILQSLSREKIELAEFMEEETQLDFDQAMSVIDMLCTEILPGYSGIGKLIAFRNEIRDPLKSVVMEESYDRCYCPPAVRYGIDIPGLGCEVCSYCAEKLDKQDIPF